MQTLKKAISNSNIIYVIPYNSYVTYVVYKLCEALQYLMCSMCLIYSNVLMNDER